jgi:hypothetical protein
VKTLRFGIEIETVGQSKDLVARAIHSVVGGTVSGNVDGAGVRDPQGRIWRVVNDGSLSGIRNGEIVSPILTYADLDTLQEVIRAVRNAGCRADDSTGIHIHVDGSRFDAKAVVNLVKTINKQEFLIERALGIREARLGRYCKPIDQQFLRKIERSRPRTLEDVSRAWYGRNNPRPNRYDESRYHGLNLNSLFFRGTVEFRYFNGTLHAGEVKAYVQFVLALAAKALASKAASSKKREFQAASAKYDFRVFLLGLGLIGDEFKTARLHLLKHLTGSAAWKNGRPARPAQPADAGAAEASAIDDNG